MTVLVTGTRGSVGSALVGLLHARGIDVRAASSNPDKLRTPDGVPRARCDLTDPATFAPALDGATSVFLYAGALHIGAFLDEASRAGVQHIVLLSTAAVAAPDAATDPIAADHVEVEAALAASRIPSTVLRPGAFAGNAKGWAWGIKSSRSVNLPYPGAHSDPLHELDLAEAALAVLTRPELAGHVYDLGGPESLSFREQVARISQVTGQQITVNAVTREVWKKEMADFVPDVFAEALLDLWQASDGVPVPANRTVEELTGHPARTFDVWLQDHAAEFRA